MRLRVLLVVLAVLVALLVYQNASATGMDYYDLLEFYRDQSGYGEG